MFSSSQTKFAAMITAQAPETCGFPLRPTRRVLAMVHILPGSFFSFFTQLKKLSTLLLYMPECSMIMSRMLARLRPIFAGSVSKQYARLALSRALIGTVVSEFPLRVAL